MAGSTSATWTGHPRIRGSSETLQLFLLTCSGIGLQFCWGTEMTYCTPFLLSLGLSKSKLSLVWVAGPLSGLVMQPIIGMISDRWTGRWGRRRPFMVGGTAGCVLLLGILGWCEGLVGLFGGSRTAVIVLAVVDIFVLDFVINIVQSTSRSLIVDTLPVEKQQLGSAWASRLTGLGHLMVYAVGSLDLKVILGSTFLGDTQFKKVCAIAAIAITVAQGITCWAVSERVLVSTGTEKDGSNKSVTKIVKDLYKTTLNLPPSIQAICWVQFWSWIGWFPFLFYSSTWVGEIYMRYDAPASATPSSSSDALSDVGRVGSRALIVFAIVSFVVAIFLPYIARSSDDSGGPPYTPRPPPSLEPILKFKSIMPTSWKPTLPAAWMAANVLFAVTMIFAPLVHSVHFATILVAICGLPWSIGGWAAFALMGTEINRLSTSLPQAQPSSYRQLSTVDDLELTTEPSTPRILHLRHDSSASTSEPVTSTGELAGVYLGILNIYTTLPQFVGTGISTIVFSILEPGKSPELAQHAPPDEHHSTDGVSGIGVCLFIGAVCAIWAAWKCRKLGGTL